MSDPQLDPWTHAWPQAAPDAFTANRSDVDPLRPGWRAVPPPRPRAAQSWSDVVWVDAVERTDARGFLPAAPHRAPLPATLVSFGVGAALTHPNGKRASFGPLAVARRVIVGSASAPVRSITLQPAGSEHGRIYYRAVRAAAATGEALREAVAEERVRLEERLAQHVLRAHPDALVICDGPVPASLMGRPRVLGWIKSTRALPLPLSALPSVRAMRRGERSPVYRVGLPEAPRFEWVVAVRDPDPVWHDLGHVVRVQAATNDPAIADSLAGWSAAWAPRFAARARHSRRAPQQPLPIEALERRLKPLLGHEHLVRSRLARHLRNQFVLARLNEEVVS